MPSLDDGGPAREALAGFGRDAQSGAIALLRSQPAVPASQLEPAKSTRNPQPTSSGRAQRVPIAAGRKPAVGARGGKGQSGAATDKQGEHGPEADTP